MHHDGTVSHYYIHYMLVQWSPPPPPTVFVMLLLCFFSEPNKTAIMVSRMILCVPGWHMFFATEDFHLLCQR